MGPSFKFSFFGGGGGRLNSWRLLFWWWSGLCLSACVSEVFTVATGPALVKAFIALTPLAPAGTFNHMRYLGSL